MSVRSEITKRLLEMPYKDGETSSQIARSIKRPEPSVRRTLSQMIKDGDVEHDCLYPHYYRLNRSRDVSNLMGRPGGL
jgi:hypothetical protein